MAHESTRAGTVARVYAETLFRTASREDAVDAVDESLRSFTELLGERPDLDGFLTAPQIDASAKRGLVQRVFEGSLHPIVLRFLDLVIGKHRETALDEIVVAWATLLDERAGRASATVTTAVPIDATLLEKVRRALEQTTGKTIRLDHEVDRSLLGGIVIRAGDTVIDGSLRTRLKTLRGRLRAASAAPVQSS